MPVPFLLSATKQEAHQMVEQAKRHATKIQHKATGGGIFGRFSNFEKCRPEVAGYHIQIGCRLGWHGCRFKIWRFYVKQSPNYSTFLPATPVLRMLCNI